MSKIKKFLLVMVVAIPVAIGVLFCGLIVLVVLSVTIPSYDSEEDSKLHASIDSRRYEYQEKVCVEMTTHYTDTLTIRTGPYEDSWFCDINLYEDDELSDEEYSAKEILSGEFDKAAWYDDKIFIYKDDLFYMLDIDEYEVPESGEEPQYELYEYTIFEMDELYPEFRDFDWYGWGD